MLTFFFIIPKTSQNYLVTYVQLKTNRDLVRRCFSQRIIAREDGTLATENINIRIYKYLNSWAKKAFHYIERYKQGWNELDMGKWGEQIPY